MPNEDNKILKYNYGEKLVKGSFVIYADLECLLEKMHSFQNNPKKSYTEKKTMNTRSGYSLFTNCLFHSTAWHSMELYLMELCSTKNKLECYRGKDCAWNGFVKI